MVTLTLGEILENKGPAQVYRPGIYVIREGELVIYVGKSERSVGERIQQHCTPRRFTGALDALGDFVQTCLPESLRLTVDVLSVKDCNQIIGSHAKSEREVEPAMISHYSPHLNATYNT